MKKRVYLETTIVSYLASRPSRDLILAAHQELTREWWEQRRANYELHASQYVVNEAAGGNDEAASRRLGFLNGVPLLETNPAVIELADALIRQRIVPPQSSVDALHLAVASVHGMNILLTWNCRHLANADRVPAIERAIRQFGYDPPVVCTPVEVMGD